VSKGKLQSNAKQQKFEKLAAKFRNNTQKQQYKSAIIHARNALKLMPSHYMVISDLAFCLLRDGQFQAAYIQYKRIFHAGESVWQQAGKTWLDGLTEVCGWLGKEQEMQRYGCLSLNLADRAVTEKTAVNFVPQTVRPSFNANDRARNIISFSLFGSAPKYCEGAVINAQLTAQLFPHWTCRFYISTDVPESINVRLLALGAQIIRVDPLKSAIHPLLWRFLVVDDEGVDYYLIRDADSLLSDKEQAAVKQWLGSQYWFHHMRDYFTHTELLLAGMWGGTRGGLPSIKALMNKYCQRHSDNKHFIDQHFLRETLWPIIKKSVLCHDELFLFHNAYPYPIDKSSIWSEYEFHIGSNCSYQALNIAIDKNEGEQQLWELKNEQGVQICQYHSMVRNKKIEIYLPCVYVKAIKKQKWKIETIVLS